MSRKLDDLDPSCREAARQAIAAMQADDELRRSGVAGILIIETRRELPVQMAYFSRGRMAPEHVRLMYDAAGVKQQLSDKETQTAITWTLKSKHLDGLAMDLVPLNDKGQAWWSAPMHVWMRMGKLAEDLGWEWGGRWKEADLPHFQWRGT